MILSIGKIRDIVVSGIDLFFGYDFFISYSHADGREYPENLLRELRADGFRVFLDTENYVVGDDLNLVTRRRVGASSHVILVARPLAMQSMWVSREITLAISRGRRVIVIDVDNSFGVAPDPHGIVRILGERIRISEAHGALPSDATIHAIRESFRGRRRDTWRVRWASLMALVFFVIAIVAVERWTAADRRAQQTQDARVVKAASDALASDPGVAAVLLRDVMRPEDWPEWPVLAGQALVQALPERYVSEATFPSWYDPSVVFPRFLSRTAEGGWLLQREGAAPFSVRSIADKVFLMPSTVPSSEAVVRVLIELDSGDLWNVVVLDLRNPEHQPRLGPFSGEFDKIVQISEDGRWLLINEQPRADGGRSELRLWHLPDMATFPLIESRSAVRAVHLSREGARIAAIADDGRLLHHWSVGGEHVRITVPGGWIAESIDISQDGRAVAFQTTQGGVGLWREGDREPRMLRERLPSPSFNDIGSPPSYLHVGFAYSGTRVVALGGASSNSAFTGIDVWDAKYPESHIELYANGLHLTDMVSNAKGPYVASEIDNNLFVWDIRELPRNGSEQRTPLNVFRTCEDFTNWFVQVWTWNPEGNRLWKLCGTNDPISREPSYAEVFDPSRGPAMVFSDASVAANGNVVLVADRTRRLIRWDMRDAFSAVKLRGPRGPAKLIAISDRGDRTAAVFSNGAHDEAWLWKGAGSTGESVASLSSIDCLALSPDGRRLAMCSRGNGNIQILSLDGPKRVSHIDLERRFVSDARFSAGGTWLFLTVQDQENDCGSRRIEAWNSVTFSSTGAAGPPDVISRAVATSEDLKTLVYVDLMGRVWSLTAGSKPRIHLGLTVTNASNVAAGVSPNGAWIAVAVQKKNDAGDEEYALYLWNPAKAYTARLIGSVPRVNSDPRVAFVGNNHVILGGDETKIWNLKDLSALPTVLDGEFIGVTRSYNDPSTYLFVTNRTLPVMNTGDRFFAIWHVKESQLPKYPPMRRIPYLGGLSNASLAGNAWLLLSESGGDVSMYPLREEFFPWLNLLLRQATDVTLLPRHRRKYLGLDVPGDTIR